MKTKPLNFLYQIGQRNKWLVAVVTVVLLLVKLLGQLPYSRDGFGFLKISELPANINRIVHFAVFGRSEYLFINFFVQLSYCLIILVWVLLIVGIIRYYGEKRSVTVLKLVALFILWEGLYESIRLVYYMAINPFEMDDFLEPYFSVRVILSKIVLPILISVLLLALLSNTQSRTDVTSEESVPFNRWQRGFHYFSDRLVVWLCGYNTYLMMDVSADKAYFSYIGVALFLTQLIVLPLISEWLFGFTLTKIITGSEVVRTDGKPISLAQALARSVIRILPFGWLSVFRKAPWIDRWTGTEVRYYSKDEPLLRLHKCVQLGSGILFFFGSWYLVIITCIALGINNYSEFSTSYFSFAILFSCLFLIPFLHSCWLATVVSHYRKLRNENEPVSNTIFIQAFYCWLPVLNFYYVGIYLDEITSHIEYLKSEEEESELISKRIKQFSGVFGLTTLFTWGLLSLIFVNTSNKYAFGIAGLISICTMIYAFFAWNFSRALKNTVVKSNTVSELIDDLGN
ncbi:MAG: RDD family protein [Fluviicola sp.]|nr:RDD family protein [Fluviicola sp.]